MPAELGLTESDLALHNSWSPIIAALFAGNAVVLKCSEHVIWSTLWFVGAIKECLRACKFNPDLVQVCWNLFSKGANAKLSSGCLLSTF